MADETNLDAGVGRCAHRGDGQHTAHRIDVIGERLHNGGIIRAKQGDIVGGNRFGGLAGGGLHLDFEPIRWPESNLEADVGT